MDIRRKPLLTRSIPAVSFLIVFLMIFSGVAFAAGSMESGKSSAVAPSGSLAPRAGRAVSGSNPITPYELYSSEPAPMGLADYGLGPGGIPYEYNTTSFLGIMKIGSVSVMNNTTQSSSISVQLNVNLEFQNAGSSYVYWAQDVAFLNTSTGSLEFIDNIWNMSSPTANMHNSTVSGNGTVSSADGVQFYYAFANYTLPGAVANITFPSTVKLKVDSILNSNGLPELEFQYWDGQGWVTYDNAIFAFAQSVTSDSGFVVNGHSYEPNGYSFFDAEMIIGGPGGGTSTTGDSANVSLQLQYWNGNNYQEISNAYNFGSDTAESIGNIVSGAYSNTSNGSLFEKLTAGKGSLSQVYDSGMVSSLKIEAPVDGGTIQINGSSTTFTGNTANLTLYPGSYSVKLYTGGVLYFSRNVLLTAGAEQILHPREYKVTFNETGLPQNSQWTVNLSGNVQTSNSGDIMYYLSNGTYHFDISRLNLNYMANTTYGTLQVDGSQLTLEIGFSPVLYKVTFRENSLGQGTAWTIHVQNSSFSSSNSTITMYFSNGTYEFNISNLTDYYTMNNSYTLTVHGSNLTDLVLFHEYSTIKGAVLPGDATVTVNGKPIALSNGNFTLHEIAGTYNISVSETGYYTYNRNVTLTSGQNISLEVNLTRIPTGASKLPGFEALGAFCAILAFAGVVASYVRKR